MWYNKYIKYYNQLSLRGGVNMLWIVISISAILIVCNALYETDETQEKRDESELNKLHKM